MPGTVDDFLNKFGANNGAIDDQQAQELHDRFVSSDPGNSQFDANTYHQGATQYLGTLPDDQFHQAASNAFAQAPQEQRQGLIGSLLGALSGHGVGVESLASTLGLSSTSPQQMTPDDFARVANYARREQPGALQQTVAEKPFLLKAMGNPVLMGILGVVASKMIGRR